MSQEPTDAELADGQYQPYRTHPTGGEVEPVRPDERATASRKQRQPEDEAGNQKFILAMVSLGAGIPITAIAATNVEPGLLGVLVAWGGIVGVNVVHHLSRRKSR